MLWLRYAQPPYPRNYDPNAKCEYHGGVVGHSIENCRQFKYKVQQLIDAGWLTFQEDKPNVEKNPFSSHASPSTNVILRDVCQSLVRRVEDIKSPLKDIFTLICQMGYFKSGGKPKVRMDFMLAKNTRSMSVLNSEVFCKIC